MAKLVRDHIPRIIRESGRDPVVRAYSEEEYARALDDKLREELEEYLESGEVEELADLQEVLLAILHCRGVAERDFQALRLNKRERNGGFAERICLLEVRE